MWAASTWRTGTWATGVWLGADPEPAVPPAPTLFNAGGARLGGRFAPWPAPIAPLTARRPHADDDVLLLLM